MQIRIVQVDYHDSEQAKHFIALLAGYALDPMGGGESLAEFTQNNLVQKLQGIPHAFSVIAYVNDKPAGLVNCFEAFSTFKCTPLVNIHDVVVAKEFRGMGISHKMMNMVESIAKDKGCGKLTLEVLSGNDIAKQSYLKFGFEPYELDHKMGKAEFWQKYIK